MDSNDYINACKHVDEAITTYTAAMVDLGAALGVENLVRIGEIQKSIYQMQEYMQSSETRLRTRRLTVVGMDKYEIAG